MDDNLPYYPTWWAITEDDILNMLFKVSTGEDPDVVYAEFYANASRFS